VSDGGTELVGATTLRDNLTVITDAERADMIRRANAAPKVHHRPDVVLHYSEDGSIKRFVPHVPPSNPSHPPAVWALDAEHAPLYWFPRHCPRISVWAYDAEQQERLSNLFDTDAARIVAAETAWLDTIRTARVFEYRFDASRFAPWAEADGQYISGEVLVPDSVEVLDDLLARHAEAEVEVRFTPLLGRLMDAMLASQLPFSFVRIRDARR
jgi:hypothetical protein